MDVFVPVLFNKEHQIVVVPVEGETLHVGQVEQSGPMKPIRRSQVRKAYFSLSVSTGLLLACFSSFESLQSWVRKNR